MNFTKCKRGRVVAAFRELFLVDCESTNELIKVKLAGKFFYENLSHPTVGDWVVIRENGVIDEVEERRSLLKRKANNDKGGEQLIAANIDFVFITTSLNDDLNFKRIDRYLMLVKESLAIPVLLFTKKDLIDQEETFFNIVTDIKNRFKNERMIFCSNTDFENEEFIKNNFESYLEKEKVWVLVGSSGVGKSTFINCFLEHGNILTKEIREDDHKGKHTTTHRQMYKTRFGQWIVDSPGIRELEIDPTDEVIDAFSDIAQLVYQCRFTNCHHESEPGCAVLNAIEVGDLESERFVSYKKLYMKKNYDLRKLTIEEQSKTRASWRKESSKMRKNSVLKRNFFIGK